MHWIKLRPNKNCNQIDKHRFTSRCCHQSKRLFRLLLSVGWVKRVEEAASKLENNGIENLFLRFSACFSFNSGAFLPFAHRLRCRTAEKLFFLWRRPRSSHQSVSECFLRKFHPICSCLSFVVAFPLPASPFKGASRHILLRWNHSNAK